MENNFLRISVNKKITLSLLDDFIDLHKNKQIFIGIKYKNARFHMNNLLLISRSKCWEYY